MVERRLDQFLNLGAVGGLNWNAEFLGLGQQFRIGYRCPVGVAEFLQNIVRHTGRCRGEAGQLRQSLDQIGDRLSLLCVAEIDRLGLDVAADAQCNRAVAGVDEGL